MQIYSYFPVCLNTMDILFCFNFCMLCFQCVLYNPLNCITDLEGNIIVSLFEPYVKISFASDNKLNIVITGPASILSMCAGILSPG